MPKAHDRNRKSVTRIASKPEGLWRVEEAPIFITLAVCGMLSIGLYLTSYAFKGMLGGFLNLSSAEQALQNRSHVKGTPPFQLAGVKMGMTPLETGALYPNFHLSGQHYGQQEGQYLLGNGIYGVTFRGPDGAKQAYSLRYKEEFRDFSEVELRQHLKRKFGPPSMIQCTKVKPVLGWECRQQWHRPDGVTIDAVIKPLGMTNGVRITQLELNAVDSYRKNFMVRSEDDYTDPKTFIKRTRRLGFTARMNLISAGARGN